MTSIKTLTTLFLLGSTFAFTGCASADSTEDITDESEEALTGASNFGYYAVTAVDMRRCASPMCGGVFVKRVNQALTRCGDGTYQAQCYVSDLSFSSLDLSEADVTEVNDAFRAKHAIVRATMRRFTAPNDARLARLNVREAWLAAAEVNVDSNVYRIADTGIRCITAPCNVLGAYQINSNEMFNLTNANFGSLGSAAERTKAITARMTTQGVLAAGSIASPKCRANATNCGPFFTAQEFYLPVVKKVAPPAGPRLCGGLQGAGCATGEFCSYKPADICGAADAMGTCAPKPDACIQVFQPVCGCDDKTYSNACMAANAGVSVVRNGACN
jgi:hypothetical protein